ncbi:MAG: hypothetical protein RJB66_933 [Pseudomonadota bacterium]
MGKDIVLSIKRLNLSTSDLVGLMKGYEVIIKSQLKKLFLFLLFLMPMRAIADHGHLNFYERSIAYAVDKMVRAVGYEFDDVYVVSLRNSTDRRGPMTLGEALLVNEELHRGVSRNQFVAMMTMSVKVNERTYGYVNLKWNPSQNLLAMIAGAILFRLDRAYASPQFILHQFENWFAPHLTVEPFTLEWFDVGKVLEAPEEEHELDFVANVVREMRLLNPDVNSVTAKGNAMYYGDRKKNRTQFVFEIITDFPGALLCTQRVRTDYNPFAKGVRAVNAKVDCQWSTSEEKRGSTVK